ncbi:unnamed protein product [Acanthosepion pharaonis]|uniref:Uncharacterized protein n=1 Tax=Acanthosepion pharaonis TaxID=158019 RepID=A0A812C118_ACAPH|nr:unnamed protein product [Sepia pharaonis]
MGASVASLSVDSELHLPFPPRRNLSQLLYTLSLSLSLSLSLPPSLPLSLSLSPSLSLSITLSPSPLSHLSMSLSLYLPHSLSLSIYLSVYRFRPVQLFFAFIFLSNAPPHIMIQRSDDFLCLFGRSIYLSIYLNFFISIYVSINLSMYRYKSLHIYR